MEVILGFLALLALFAVMCVANVLNKSLSEIPWFRK